MGQQEGGGVDRTESHWRRRAEPEEAAGKEKTDHILSFSTEDFELVAHSKSVFNKMIN